MNEPWRLWMVLPSSPISAAVIGISHDVKNAEGSIIMNIMNKIPMKKEGTSF
jgi:hypothetical protein